MHEDGERLIFECPAPGFWGAGPYPWLAVSFVGVGVIAPLILLVATSDQGGRYVSGALYHGLAWFGVAAVMALLGSWFGSRTSQMVISQGGVYIKSMNRRWAFDLTEVVVGLGPTFGRLNRRPVLQLAVRGKDRLGNEAFISLARSTNARVLHEAQQAALRKLSAIQPA